MAAANQKAPQPLSLVAKLEMLHKRRRAGTCRNPWTEVIMVYMKQGPPYVAMNHIETKLHTCCAIMFAPLQSQILYHLALCFALHLEFPGSCTLTLFD